MTRKHYVAVAKALKALRKESRYDAESFAVVRVADVAAALADIFAEDNGQFDRTRFLKACE